MTKPFSFTIKSLLLVSILFVSCSKNNDEAMTPIDSMDEEMVAMEANEVGFKGVFQASAHPTSGTAAINLDLTVLNFENFKTDAGPDLNIYLVSDLSDIKSDFKDLGDIKGIDGSYSYLLPSNIDYKTYTYVVIWCVDFDVNFGYATLAP
tara:strand:+ start:3920 stop:4369 length:450 start_codon:yes stop_codon:yes gene_type:complete